VAGRYHTTRGARLVRFTLHSRLTHRDLHEILVEPRHHGKWLLVLLHGKGAGPSQFLSQPFFDTLAALGGDAPDVLLLDGGDDSYWHDRADGKWGSMLVREAVPAGARRTMPRRIAIGGISMGGYGALLLGSRRPGFCAVAVQSPALWLSAGETAPGAFDDARTTNATTSSSCGRHGRSGSTSARAIRSATPRSPMRGGRACTRTWRRADTTPHSGTRRCRTSYASSRMPAPDPKIELHVHLEGTVRPDTLRQIAKRNDHALPDDLDSLYHYRDFAHFIEAFNLVAHVLQQYDDFRQVVVDYAAEAKAHGAVYLEGIFAPGLWRGVDTDQLFAGYCDGAQQARDLHGVEVRLTPDIPRVYPLEDALTTARFAVKYRDRGVVGIGLGGPEDGHPPEPYEDAFALAREGGLASVPHAGEAVGAESVRGALETLGADRIRHGIRSVEDPGLVGELADRGTVLDICPLSNLRTGVVRSLEEHPLPQLVAAGVRCSISTDDPAMFDTDLTRDYEAAASLGVSPRAAYEAGLAGALCNEETRARLRQIGESHDWDDR
jgi:aminodeoxyfutalosine deaminase